LTAAELNLAVVGLGFVGLTTALGFAEKGFRVFAFEKDENKRNYLQSGEVPFHEPGLAEALRRHGGNRLQLVCTMEEAVQAADLVFLCVGTPVGDQGQADLRSLTDALDEALSVKLPEQYCSYVIKSSVPPGTVSGVLAERLHLRGLLIGQDAGLACNPEFLREGSAWRDFMKPDRIVAGCIDELTRNRLNDIYERFDATYEAVEPVTAEFVKYASNALLATLISFANEQAAIAEQIGGIDIPAAFRLLVQDRRWSGQPAAMSGYVYPGCGYGGYCLPKDTLALQYLALSRGVDTPVLSSVINVNVATRLRFVDKITKRIERTEERIGILGLSFKPGSDDVRGSQASEVIRLLLDRGCNQIIGYDPLAMPAFERAYGLPIQYARSLEEAVERCDILVIVTAWDEFVRDRSLLETRKLVDGRYVFSTASQHVSSKQLLRHF